MLKHYHCWVWSHFTKYLTFSVVVRNLLVNDTHASLRIHPYKKLNAKQIINALFVFFNADVRW